MSTELFRDLSGLGGLPILGAVAALGWAYQERAFTLRLGGSLAAGYLLCAALKLSWFRSRPEPEPYTTAIERYDANSFPSVHCMRGAVLWSAIALRDPSPLPIAVCASAAGLVAASRVALKRHHLLDAVAGLLVGLLASFLVSLVG